MRCLGKLSFVIGLLLLTGGVAWSDQQTQTHTYEAPGTYDACVTVTDQYGAATRQCVQVTVRGNLPPVVALVASPPTGVAPFPVTFTATISDPDGDPVTSEWNFGDAPTP